MASGLAWSDDQVDDLTDFLENGLIDPRSRTSIQLTDEVFQLAADFLLSVYRPDSRRWVPLTAGQPVAATDNNDALFRRDADSSS